MISIAPMIDISNHHFRAFVRLLTKKATVYTEMKSADAVIHNHQTILPFHESQHPIILQIGGCEPAKLAQAARIGE
jgi:tRNA-dihydrouridine synthase A